MKSFPITTPGSPGYKQALARAKRVFSGQETGWKLTDCDKQDEPEKTKVIFRTHRGDVIALFPEIPATHTGRDCESYMHAGQHGAACPNLARYGFRLATPEEYAPLKAELERIGYTLEIRQKITPTMTRNRYASTRP